MDSILNHEDMQITVDDLDQLLANSAWQAFMIDYKIALRTIILDLTHASTTETMEDVRFSQGKLEIIEEVLEWADAVREEFEIEAEQKQTRKKE